MPSPHARLQIVTIPPVRTQLERIAAATGQSMGSIVREMLEEMLLGLEAMADALELVPKSPGEAMARMSKGLDDAVSGAKQVQLDLGIEKPTLVQRRVLTSKKVAKAMRKAVTQ
jgi:plasmid stability protein